MTTQPLDLDAIQAARDVVPGQWWNDSFEIYVGEPGIPAASTWIGETCSVDLPDGGEANATAIVTALNAVPALIARVRQLETELAKYVGHEPTIAEEMAELGRRLNAVEQLLPGHPDDDNAAPYISPRLLRAALDGDIPRTVRHAPDEWLRCSGLHCPNAERYAKAEERGWLSSGMGQWLCPGCRMGRWLCPDCSTATATSGPAAPR